MTLKKPLKLKRIINEVDKDNKGKIIATGYRIEWEELKGN